MHALQVQTIWWRGLLLPPGAIPRRQPLPLDMYRAAALSGSMAVLCTGEGGARPDATRAGEGAGDASTASLQSSLQVGARVRARARARIRIRAAMLDRDTC